MITESLKQTLARNFWQTSGNNIHNLPGVELLTAGPGALGTVYGQEVRAISTGFVVLQRHVSPRPGTTFLDFTHEVIFSTQDEAALVAWLTVNGRVSEGGQ